MKTTQKNSTYGVYDFALLGLEHAAQMTQVVELICLPSRNVPHIGSKLTVSGWGSMIFNTAIQPNKLQYVTLTGNSPKECVKEMKKSDIFISPNIILCAGKGELKGTYIGDSGGSILLI